MSLSTLGNKSLIVSILSQSSWIGSEIQSCIFFF